MITPTKVHMMDYMVHFTSDQHRIEFTAFPIVKWARGEETGISYLRKGDYEMTDSDDPVAKFQGSFCWRGVWEGRIYFMEEEYWGEDLREMADLYDLIEDWCINAIKTEYPLDTYS